MIYHRPTLLGLLTFCLLDPVFAQQDGARFYHESKIYAILQEKMAEERPTTVFKPFRWVRQHQTPSQSLNRAVSLALDQQVLMDIIRAGHSTLRVDIPSFDGKILELELFKAEIYSEGFRVVTSESNDQAVATSLGLHYRGVLAGAPESIVAFSFFETQAMGMISLEGHNIAIVPDELHLGEYLLFDDADIALGIPFSCEVLEHGNHDIGYGNPQPSLFSSKCIRVYIECDYALFLNKGSRQATVDWITAVFNNVATLYQNETISTAISEIMVWTTSDPYSKTDSYTALTQFRNRRPTFNGDLAHLAALGGQNIGGIAWLDVLCTSYKYAYSNIASTYRNVPAYSWTVQVFTHEMGHNIGSNHTHWCGWVGGALDNCYQPEGSCARGPAPNNGGTIMSYCHLTSYGINFNNGFGQQPGDKIRAEVSAAACLGNNCSGGGSCNAPTGLAAGNITQNSATLSWNPVSGAANYTLDYKQQGSNTWTSVTTTATSHTLTGLVPNTTYEARVRAKCGSNNSPYSSTISFTTLGSGGSYCESRGNNASQEWISRVKLGSIDRISGSDGGYFNGTSLSTNLARGSQYSIYFQAGIQGLPRRLHWRVWIDFNRNGSFSDAGEMVVSGFSSSANLLYANFAVPPSALLGPTRMRVSMKNGGYPNECEVFSFGEVEDYSVNILASGSLKPGDKAISQDRFELVDVAPNPCMDVVVVKYRSSTQHKFDIECLNVMGQKVLAESVYCTEGDNVFELNTHSLISGPYLLRFRMGEQQLQQKILKL